MDSGGVSRERSVAVAVGCLPFKEASERFGDLAFLDSLVVTDQ